MKDLSLNVDLDQSDTNVALDEKKILRKEVNVNSCRNQD